MTTLRRIDMMKLNRLLAAGLCLTAIALLAVPASARSVNKNAGTSSFSFLKINLGARPVSMGGAFTGLADDASALYYNPAGIAGLESNAFLGDYHNYFTDIQSGMVSYVRKVGYDKSIAGFITYLDYGDFIQTDDQGNITGDFGGFDMVVGATYAMKYQYNFMFGATGKLIYEDIDIYSASALAVDLGVKYVTDREHYSAGIMLQNLGTQLSALGKEKNGLPTLVRLGGAGRFRGLPFQFAGDIIVPFDNDIELAGGIEYNELDYLRVRAGYNSFGTNYRTADSEDSWAGLAAGVGFLVKDWEFSYSFSPAAELGESHRVTVTWQVRPSNRR